MPLHRLTSPSPGPSPSPVLTFAPLHRSSAPICTFALLLCLSPALESSGPRVLVSAPCPRASMSPRASACPRVTVSPYPLTRFLLKNPPPLHLTPPQQPQPFRMPGKTESQPEDDQRQPRREGQGNGNQPRDDQDRPRDRPGRLDNAEHANKVTNSPTTQATPSLYASGRAEHPCSAAVSLSSQPLTANR